MKNSLNKTGVPLFDIDRLFGEVTTNGGDAASDGDATDGDASDGDASDASGDGGAIGLQSSSDP